MSEAVTAPSTTDAVVVPGYVPVIDFSGATSSDPARRAAVGAALDEACRTSGFFTVVGHGIDPTLMETAIDEVRTFFELPMAAKERYLAAKGDPTLRGLRVWHNQGAGYDLDTINLEGFVEDPDSQEYARARRPDICELFTMNRLGEPGVAEGAGLGEHFDVWSKPNVWPTEVETMRPAWLALYTELERFAQTTMRMFALGLGLAETHFDGIIDEHLTNLCANYYPAVRGEVGPEQFRKMPHTDSGTVTILYQDVRGLQVIDRRSGEWVDVPYVPGSYVVNIGDLMALWTNDRWVSTMHRVLVPPPADRSVPRISMPFFHQPNWNALIECLPTCRVDGEAPKHAPVLSGEYLEYKVMPLAA
ncbi:isopenicillin N synthase family oxygenase [Frankia sp. R43]|uniref:isopenicillin N synthase family dioxygenase n=1 Tax=Frankia sp. R43 TaxID=269536 RepID=UPI000A478E02|nr:2OG-Fe(II) oxygenase family protein [Frankia sp. R43]